METAFIQKAHHQGDNYILPVMAERKFSTSQFPAGVCQHGTAHFGTEGAGIFFFSVIKDDFADLSVLYHKRHIQIIAKASDR